MADFIKMAAKVALIVIITAAVIAIFANVQIPSITTSLITDALGVGLAVFLHWTGNLGQILWNCLLVLIAIDIAMLAFKLVRIGYRWILKVNE